MTQAKCKDRLRPGHTAESWINMAPEFSHKLITAANRDPEEFLATLHKQKEDLKADPKKYEKRLRDRDAKRDVRAAKRLAAGGC